MPRARLLPTIERRDADGRTTPSGTGRASRRIHTAVSIAVVGAMAAGIAGCSKSSGTTQLKTVDAKEQSAASTTSIVVETVPTTTTIDFESTSQGAAPVANLQSTLSQLVSGFAADPQLLSAVKAISDGDLAAIAKLFNIDLSAISQLGMTVSQIGSLGDSVAEAAPTLIGQLVAGAGGGSGGPIDAGTLIGLLAGSVDINGIAQGAIAQLVQLLSDSLAKTELKISPEVTIYLDQILKEIDPNGLGEISANPYNASFIALITSVILSANPLLTEQLLDNPLLDPKLKNLLSDLGELNASLGETASSAILAALQAIFPGLGQA